jgi:hypothetical protein
MAGQAEKTTTIPAHPVNVPRFWPKMNTAIFWDVPSCGLEETKVSTVHTASIIRTIINNYHTTRRNTQKTAICIHVSVRTWSLNQGNRLLNDPGPGTWTVSRNEYKNKQQYQMTRLHVRSGSNCGFPQSPHLGSTPWQVPSTFFAIHHTVTRRKARDLYNLPTEVEKTEIYKAIILPIVLYGCES